jgi:hypothetical protein
MFYYATISNENIVIAISELTANVQYDDMISIPSYNLSFIGKLWTGKEFIDNPNPPVIEELTSNTATASVI